VPVTAAAVRGQRSMGQGIWQEYLAISQFGTPTDAYSQRVADSGRQAG
jgi:hypothetical protein